MVEAKDQNSVYLAVENFSIEKATAAKERKEGVTLSGFALPFDKTSRNGFSYRKESIEKTAQSLEGKPMFFNHNVEAVPIGKVANVHITEKGLEYTAKLKPVTEEGQQVVDAIKEGLIENVSIQCIYENAKFNEKSETFEVDVREFLELSAVAVPGFADTTAQIVEGLQTKNKMVKVKEELKKNLAKEEAVEEPQDENEVSDVESRMTELENQMSAIRASLDSLQEEKDSEGEREEEEDSEDKTEESEDKPEEEKSEESDDSEDEEDKAEEVVRKTVATSAESDKQFNGADYAKLRYNL